MAYMPICMKTRTGRAKTRRSRDPRCPLGLNGGHGDRGTPQDGYQSCCKQCRLAPHAAGLVCVPDAWSVPNKRISTSTRCVMVATLQEARCDGDNPQSHHHITPETLTSRVSVAPASRDPVAIPRNRNPQSSGNTVTQTGRLRRAWRRPRFTRNVTSRRHGRKYPRPDHSRRRCERRGEGSHSDGEGVSQKRISIQR